MHRVEGVRHAEARDVVGRGHRHRFDDLAALGAQAGQRWRHVGRAKERSPGNAIRRRHVLFHQHRRQRQHVSNVVEPVAGVVLREVVCRTRVDAQQLLDRVVVLVAIEPARGDAARIRRCRRVDVLELFREPADDRRPRFFAGLLLFERRHLAAAQPADHFFPFVALGDERGEGLERLEVERVLLLLVAMAREAVLCEERPDERVEAGAGVRRLRRLRRPRLRWRCRLAARRLRRLLGRAHDNERAAHERNNEERPHPPPKHGGAYRPHRGSKPLNCLQL